MTENETEVLSALGRLIGQNADWMSGRDFQLLALHAAAAHFEAADLDPVATLDEFSTGLAAALAKELPSLAGDPVEM